MTIVNKHIIMKNVVCKLHNNYWKRFIFYLVIIGCITQIFVTNKTNNID